MEFLQSPMKKGPSSQASSNPSSPSMKNRQGMSSPLSFSSTVKKITMGLPTEKDPTEEFSATIKETRSEERRSQVAELFSTLILPYNRETYYDSLAEASEVYETRKLTRFKSSFTPVTRSEVVIKFESHVSKLMLSFRNLRRNRYMHELYSVPLDDFESYFLSILSSPFVNTKVRGAVQIEKMALKEFLGQSSHLPDTISQYFFDQLFLLTDTRYLGVLQAQIIDTFSAFARVNRFRPAILSSIHKFLDLFRENKLFKSSMKHFTKMLAELALYEDINWEDFELLDQYLYIIQNPVPPKLAVNLINKNYPELLKVHKFYEYQERRKTIEQQLSKLRHSFTVSPRKTLMPFQDATIKEERLKDIRYEYRLMRSNGYMEQQTLIKSFDEIDEDKVLGFAARGLSRLMIPCQAFSLCGISGTAKRVIYEDLLHRELLLKLFEESHPILKPHFSLAVSLFVMQTTTESKFREEHVIFYLKRLGLLEIVSRWSKDKDPVVCESAASIFKSLCVHRLVPPLELTKQGIVRDIFSLYLRAPVKRIQHLIFSTFIFLSNYDNLDVMAYLQSSSSEEIDKPVEESALYGLMEFIQQEHRQEFTQILVQFTICDDYSFQQNGIWYLKHIIINSDMNELIISAHILDVFIAGCACESEAIQLECVNVLTYLAIEKRAYMNAKEDPLLQAFMYLTGVQFPKVRGLAYNGLAALALHGEYASEIILKQCEGENYYNNISAFIKQFKKQFLEDNYKSDTVATYAGINLLVNLARSATVNYQKQVSQRVPLILDTISAQNQLCSGVNMNEIGCLQTVKALMNSTDIWIREEWVLKFIDKVVTEDTFRLDHLLVNSKFIIWCLELIEITEDPQGKIIGLMKKVMFKYYFKMNLQENTTRIQNLFNILANREIGIKEELIECFLLIFLKKETIIHATNEKILFFVEKIMMSFEKQSRSTKLAFIKHLGSTAHMPQVLNFLLDHDTCLLNIIDYYLESDSYEDRLNMSRILVSLTDSTQFVNDHKDILKKICENIDFFYYQDMHFLIFSVIKYSSVEWVYSENYFQRIIQRCKENDCHSLNQASLELINKSLDNSSLRKLLLEKPLLKQILYIFKRALTHKCTMRCTDMASKTHLFYVDSYKLNWISYKSQCFKLAVHLIKENNPKIKEVNTGEYAVSCFKKVCKTVSLLRTVDEEMDKLIKNICLFFHIQCGIIRHSGLSTQLLSLCKTLCNKKIVKIDSISLLILQISVIAPVNKDQNQLLERVSNILYILNNTNLTVISLKSFQKLFLHYRTKITDISFIFNKTSALGSIVPALNQENDHIQQEALHCIGYLIDNKLSKQEFIDLKMLGRVLEIGEKALREKKTELLESFGFVISILLNENLDIANLLLNSHDFLAFTVKCIETHPCVYFGDTLKNLAQIKSIQGEILRTMQQLSLNSAKELDNSIANIYAILAANTSNDFHKAPRFQEFTKIMNRICTKKTENLSTVEVASCVVLLSTFKDLVGSQLKEDRTEEEMEEFLQYLNESGGLETLLHLEKINVREIREMAESVIESLIYNQN